jgi:phage gp36-like protein
MPYATQSDLVGRFGNRELVQLTNIETPSATSLNGAVADRALADASAEIDTYLAGRFALPLAVVPSVLVRLCCDIARYRLAENRSTEEMRRRYEDATRVLEQVRDGKLQLGLEAVDAAAALPSGGVQVVQGASRVFGASELADYAGRG